MTRTAIFLWAVTSALGAGEPAHVTLTAVGDILPWHWPIDQRAYQSRRQREVPYPWTQVRTHLEGVVFGNLEGPFSDFGHVPFADKDEPSYFAVPARYAPGLKFAGFDILSLANNHLRDAGDHGLFNTINLLRAQGIKPLGAGKDQAAARLPMLIEENGVKLGFLAFDQVPPKSVWAGPFSPGAAHAEPEEMEALVRALKPRVDHVVVSLHWGPEYRFDRDVRPPSPSRVALARRLCDAGATVILGHHSHTVERVEAYKGSLIFYGLGNFMFGATTREGHQHGMLAKVYLDQKGIKGKKLLPVAISPRKVRYQPRVLGGKEAERVLEVWRKL